MCKIMEDIKNEGRAEGCAEGRAEGQNQMMAKMFSKGYSNEQVAEIADKTLEEVEKLRSKYVPLV